ncbi:hypothetical protein DYD21_19475 [Rhodohalobacter sp. SW132]|uniref:hypothetical protein n=1 Tax=Rhodohalobacter sp. SW132 TaxID=2293433 RepID=UPI000E27D257|nr:hypothetical protein [Rhodohalobacter sp. SW132]REL24162.1 hypothetical protein DYD21_19475 [Rhodohalobacter sp. SW132]
MKQILQLLLVLLISLSVFSCSDEPQRSEVESQEFEQNHVIKDLPRLMMQSGTEFLFIPVGHLTEEFRTPEHIDRDAVRSFIFVQPNDSLDQIRQYESGRVVELSLDEDLRISARINRNQAMGQRIRNLSATIQEPYEGVITLSVDSTRITGNIDLVSENRLFHLRYDSLSDLHYLAEIDREKLDVMDGDGPLQVID